MPRKLPEPKPAAKRVKRAAPPPEDDDMDDQECDPDDEVDDQPRKAIRSSSTRRMSTGDRQQAELTAALKAKLTGKPVFPFPAELHNDHKPYWVEVVNCKPHDYFNAGDTHLLKLYCRVAADIDRLDREIAEEGSVVYNARGNPIVNPRTLVRCMAETRLLTLSTKLRMQPSSRYDSDGDRKQGEKKKRADAAADTMFMHGDVDGDDDLIARSAH